MNLMKVTFSGIITLGVGLVHYFSLFGVNLGCYGLRGTIHETIVPDDSFTVIREYDFVTGSRNGLMQLTGLFTAWLSEQFAMAIVISSCSQDYSIFLLSIALYSPL